MAPPHSKSQDSAIINTADRALQAKLSCTEHNYYNDPFLSHMSRGCITGDASSSNRMMEPIIRRGTHARVLAVDRAIESFLNLQLSTYCRQIVVLGAGRDTSYLRYRFGHLATVQLNECRVRWYEVDHLSVVTQKAFDWLPGCVPSGYDFNRTAVSHSDDGTTESYVISFSSKQQEANQHNSSYHLIGHDLRNPPSDLFDLLSHQQHAYDETIPTLFVLECVVMYLPEDASRQLLSYIADTVPNEGSAFAAVVLYDPIPCHDRFGEVMIQNLQKAGILSSKRRRQTTEQQQEEDPILSLEATRTISDQLSKLQQCGFTKSVGCDMYNAYNYGVIKVEDFRHAARCEMLDELEEFALLMSHYCFCVGVKCAERDSVGYRLCSVGKESLIGFQDGHCMLLQREN